MGKLTQSMKTSNLVQKSNVNLARGEKIKFT